MATTYKSSLKIENKIINSMISRIFSLFYGRMTKNVNSVEKAIDNAYAYSDDIANAFNKKNIKNNPVFYYVSNF